MFKKRRRGYSLPEVIITTVILAFITFVVARVNLAISTMRTSTNNTVLLSLHNLQIMEELRQDCRTDRAGLLLSYGDDMLGSADIETTATVKESTLGNYKVYNVTIQSKMRNFNQRLTSNCILSTIGGVGHD